MARYDAAPFPRIHHFHQGFDKHAARTARDRAIAMTELHGVLDQPIDTLSKGFRRRVGLAQAIVHDPDVLIMDEPTDGLDPNQKFQVRRAIEEMAEKKAIIISTHILEEVDAICTNAMIIDRGLLSRKAPSQLAAQSRYHGAVTLTVAAQDLGLVQSALADMAGVSIETSRRGDEAALHVFAQKGGPEPAALLADIRAHVAAAQIDARGLALESGRLDELFGALTVRARKAIYGMGQKARPCHEPALDRHKTRICRLFRYTPCLCFHHCVSLGQWAGDLLFGCLLRYGPSRFDLLFHVSSLVVSFLFARHFNAALG